MSDQGLFAVQEMGSAYQRFIPAIWYSYEM